MEELKDGYKNFLHASVYERWFRSGIHSLRRPNDERNSADCIYVIMTHIAVLRLAHSNLTSQVRSRIKHLIPCDNIIFLERHPNLTKKILTGRPLIRFIENSIAANYFFGPPFIFNFCSFVVMSTNITYIFTASHS